MHWSNEVDFIFLISFYLLKNKKTTLVKCVVCQCVCTHESWHSNSELHLFIYSIYPCKLFICSFNLCLNVPGFYGLYYCCSSCQYKTLVLFFSFNESNRSKKFLFKCTYFYLQLVLWFSKKHELPRTSGTNTNAIVSRLSIRILGIEGRNRFSFLFFF